MSDHRARLGIIARALVHEIRVERITFMAGSIAYNAFVSLLPLLLLLLLFVSTIGNQGIEEGFLELTSAVVTPEIGEVLIAELSGAPPGASVIGLVALIWGMLRIFRSLDLAFSNIYETTARTTLRNQIHDGTIAFISVAAVVVGAVAIKQLLPAGGIAGGAWFVQRPVLVVVIALALFPLYYLFPDEPDLRVIETLPGVAFAAVGLVALESMFGLYTAVAGPSVDHNLLAGVLVFMAWLYLCALVILLGVVLNAVLTNRSEDVSIRPVIGGYEPDTDRSTPGVDEATLRELNRALTGASSLAISVDGEATYTLPAPDLTTLDTDTSSSPFINDMAGIELEWTHLTTADTFTP